MGNLKASMDFTRRLDGSINLYATNWGIWERGGLAQVNYWKNLGQHTLTANVLISHKDAQTIDRENWQSNAATTVVSWEFSDWIDLNTRVRQEINQIPGMREREFGNFLSADLRTRLNPDVDCSPTRASLLASASRGRTNYRSSHLLSTGILINPFSNNLVEMEVRYLHSGSENDITFAQALTGLASFFTGLPGKIENRAWMGTVKTSIPLSLPKWNWDMTMHLTANSFRTWDQSGQLAGKAGALPQFAYGMQQSVKFGSFSFTGVLEGLANDGLWNMQNSLLRIQQSALSYNIRNTAWKMLQNIQINLSAQNIPLFSRKQLQKPYRHLIATKTVGKVMQLFHNLQAYSQVYILA